MIECRPMLLEMELGKIKNDRDLGLEMVETGRDTSRRENHIKTRRSSRVETGKSRIATRRTRTTVP